ncbi:MAG: hypothetical protein AAGM36_16715, partial [Cyanobacteria bacterium J06597_1]
YQQLLCDAAGCLPAGVEVVLLADRGFVHTDLMRALTMQWRWHYRIRLKKDSWIKRDGHGWCQLKDFHFQWGQAVCLHNVRLHKQAGFGPVHIIVDATASMASFGPLSATSQPICRPLPNSV